MFYLRLGYDAMIHTNKQTKHKNQLKKKKHQIQEVRTCFPFLSADKLDLLIAFSSSAEVLSSSSSFAVARFVCVFPLVFGWLVLDVVLDASVEVLRASFFSGKISSSSSADDALLLITFFLVIYKQKQHQQKENDFDH